MSGFSINYDTLSETVSKRKLKLTTDIQAKLEKVAFDICRFKNEDPEELWQVQNSDDGDYIVALYDETVSATKKAQKTASKCWEVLASQNNDLNVFYKGEPIVKMASAKLGIKTEDISIVIKHLPAKLASNKVLVNALLKEVPETVRHVILKKYPELG